MVVRTATVSVPLTMAGLIARPDSASTNSPAVRAMGYVCASPLSYS